MVDLLLSIPDEELCRKLILESSFRKNLCNETLKFLEEKLNATTNNAIGARGRLCISHELLKKISDASNKKIPFFRTVLNSKIIIPDNGVNDVITMVI